jgi:PAS domain S-box-containing protein
MMSEKPTYEELEKRIQELEKTKSKLKSSEADLLESKQVIKGILNTIPARVFWKDQNLVYLGCNKLFAQDAGFADPKDIVGKDDYQMGWRDQAEFYREDDQEVIDSGDSKFLIEEPQTTPEGDTITLLTSKTLLRNATGDIIGMLGAYMDITDRKQAEEALKLNEQRYKNAQRMGRVGNWEYDLLTENFWGSDEAKRIYGFDPESRVFKTDEVKNCIPDRERVHQALVDLIEKGQPYDLEFEIRPITGPDKKIIKAIAELVKNDSGIPIKIAGVIQDITERNQAENALKEGEAFLGALIDAIPVPVFYKNRTGQYLGFNKAFESFFGKTKEHLIGKSVFDVNPKDLAEIYHAKDKELFEKEGKQQYESQVKNANGELRNVIFNKSVYTDNQGSVVGLIASISDITDRIQAETELRKSEEKFRVLFESSKDPNYLSTIEGIIIDANQSFFDLFDYTKDDLHHLKTQDLYVNPDDRIAFINEVERYGFAKDFEEKLRDKNGNVMDCQITATFRRSVDGTNNGYQGIIRNVTDIKRKQIEREKLISELQDALSEVKTLSGLLPICSHCKKIRDDKGYWNQIEAYIGDRSEAVFSHSICQECAKELYPDMDIYD